MFFLCLILWSIILFDWRNKNGTRHWRWFSTCSGVSSGSCRKRFSALQFHIKLVAAGSHVFSMCSTHHTDSASSTTYQRFFFLLRSQKIPAPTCLTLFCTLVQLTPPSGWGFGRQMENYWITWGWDMTSATSFTSVRLWCGLVSSDCLGLTYIYSISSWC